MRDVCPKCLHRVKPEHVEGTGQGYAQLWRCPECGEVVDLRHSHVEEVDFEDDEDE